MSTFSLRSYRSLDSGSGTLAPVCCVLYASITTSFSFLGVSSTLDAKKRAVVAMLKRSCSSYDLKAKKRW